MKILVEASGCLTAGYIIKAVQTAGHICVGTDANPESFGKYLSNEFYTVPFANEKCSKDFLYNLVRQHNIHLIIPTLDDGLLNWADLREKLQNENIFVAGSSKKTLKICLDKWETYLFFKENGIPTPETSLEQKYPLVKPRFGRGGGGIQITEQSVDMTGNISQELLSGTEYTIDVFCNKSGKPIYIVPRVRFNVKEGKSTGGIVVKNAEIEDWVKKICASIRFEGPINIQCFETQKGIKFTEINPRMGGGTALGMAATENWIPLIVSMYIEQKEIEAREPIKYGMKMGRFYDEVFYM